MIKNPTKTMIDRLLTLNANDMISVDEDSSKQFTGCEDFVISEINKYNYDGAEIVIVSLDDYTLIASSLTGDARFAICELYDEGEEYLEDDRFTEVLELTGGESVECYELNEAVYSDEGNETTGFAEYTLADGFYNFLIVHKSHKHVLVYRGITVEEDNIIL